MEAIKKNPETIVIEVCEDNIVNIRGKDFIVTTENDEEQTFKIIKNLLKILFKKIT